MVERDGKLYCSDNSLDSSTAQPTAWSLSYCMAAPVRSANLRHPSSESCYCTAQLCFMSLFVLLYVLV